MLSQARSAPRFVPDQTDPVRYDREALAYLISQCHEPIDRALESIRSRSFDFGTMQLLHDDAVDTELVYRQSIPAACLGSDLASTPESLADYIVLFATCQTLILNHIDRHLDLSASYTIRDPQRLLADVRSVMCYAVAALYEGMKAAPTGSGAASALGEMADVSSRIIQSMYDNYALRFNMRHLRSPEVLRGLYADEIRSRHLGSGFYGSSISGLYAYFGAKRPQGLSRALRDMRRLRQRVDEMSDLFEDTVTGLLTYPTVRLLCLPEYQQQTTRAITAAWTTSRRIVAEYRDRPDHANQALRESRKLSTFIDDLMQLLNDSGTLRSCCDEIEQLWRSLDKSISECAFGPRPEDAMKVVIDLKRAFLERLRTANWVDTPPPHTFEEIRLSVTVRGEHDQHLG